MEALRPIVWINAVGLTPRLLAHAPRLHALAEQGGARALGGVIPAVTCTAQASALTGLTPSGHGIVGNGWFHRSTGEVRFWLQSNRLIQGETIYGAAARLAAEREQPFSVAKMFWWFNQGAPVDYAVTPKPWYGADGSKAFGIHGKPHGLVEELEQRFGDFPFFSFWGPKAGLPSTDWIARASAHVIESRRPTLTLVYLPHLDYDLQRFGPDHHAVGERVAELDRAAGLVIDAADRIGAEVMAFSEYGIVPVSHVSYPNRMLREAGLLQVRDGPFGETIDTFQSRAFAVCDHQVAHIYVRDPGDWDEVEERLTSLDGVGRVLNRDARIRSGLEHPRSGDLILIARADSWFAYPYWLDDKRAPDFARTVDIHRKPGYDPCELFVDPKLTLPMARVAGKLLKKKLGMRYLMDVVPLDATLVKGSHGILPVDPDDGAILLSGDRAVVEAAETLADLKRVTLERMGLSE